MDKPNFPQDQRTFDQNNPRDLAQVKLITEHKDWAIQQKQLKDERVGWKCYIFEAPGEPSELILRVLICPKEDMDNLDSRIRPRGKIITSYSIVELLWILDTIRSDLEHSTLNPPEIINLQNLSRKKKYISRIIKRYVFKFGQSYPVPPGFYMKGLTLLPLLDPIPDKLCRIVMPDQMVRGLNQLKAANAGWRCSIYGRHNFSLPHYSNIQIHIMDQRGRRQNFPTKQRNRGRPRRSDTRTFYPVELLWILGTIRSQAGIYVPSSYEKSIDISSYNLRKQRDVIRHILYQYIPDGDIPESSC